MQMMQLAFADLRYLGPELTLVIAAILLSLLDLVVPRRFNRSWLGGLTLLSLAVSAVFVVIAMRMYNGADAEAIQLLAQSYRVDDFGNLLKLFILTGTFLTVLMSFGTVKDEDIPHQGEYYYLFLPAALGAMVMVSSGDLITLFVGLELLSITSYIMVGLKKNDQKSNESAFKYVVLGGISTAFILYGMSFLYGVTGTTNMAAMNAELRFIDPSMSGLVYMSFFLMLAGFAFKIASAPFHAWAPDVYQGAHTPVTAFLAVVSKGAALALLFRILYNVYFNVGDSDTPIHDDLFLIIAIIAAASMILGNAMALKQHNMKRLLAYSGIANAGYLLVPLAAEFGPMHYSNFTELYYYLAAYLFMNIGAFAALIAVSRSAGHEEMSAFDGLYYRNPALAAGMVILVLSLAGLPITGGFFGKFYILLGTVAVAKYWLAAIMIITSVISFYYYFGIIRQMFMRSHAPSERLHAGWAQQLTVWICAGATILMGIFPKPIIGYIEQIFHLTVDFFI